MDISGLEIELEVGTNCSLMAFGNVKNVSISGTDYALKSEDLQTGTRGVGNRVNSNPVTISHDGGDLLFIWEANVL